MASPSDWEPIRPLSNLELYSSSRHYLGIYRSVNVTCRYTHPSQAPSSTDDAHPIFAALAPLVRRHPMLRVCIASQESNAPMFTHVRRIDLREHVEFQTAPAGAGYEAALAALDGEQHDRVWGSLEVRPPWSVLVLRPEGGDWEDVIFSFHHSLMDGACGKMFHEQLLASFNHPVTPAQSNSSPDAIHILDFPEPPVLPPPQDQAIPYSTSTLFLVRELWNEFGPSFLKSAPIIPWHASKVDLSLPYITRILPFDLPPEVVASLLAACRANGNSLTGLLNALVLAALARRLPAADAAAFASTTPISLRNSLPAGTDPALKDELSVLLSHATHTYPASSVAPLRDPTADLDEEIWRVARQVKAEIATRVATLPNDDVIGLLNYVSDWFAFWRKKDGQPREHSWQLSNLGAIAGADSDDWRITRIMFTNGAMTAGPPVFFNVASVAGGVLTVALSWQDGILPQGLAEGLMKDLEGFATRLLETGKFAE